MKTKKCTAVQRERESPKTPQCQLYLAVTYTYVCKFGACTLPCNMQFWQCTYGPNAIQFKFKTETASVTKIDFFFRWLNAFLKFSFIFWRLSYFVSLLFKLAWKKLKRRKLEKLDHSAVSIKSSYANSNYSTFSKKSVNLESHFFDLMHCIQANIYVFDGFGTTNTRCWIWLLWSFKKCI